jgi:hypothetical protein
MVAVEISSIAVRAFVLHHVPDSGLVGVEAGEQACPRRAATGGVIELREPQAVRGEVVEVRGADFPAIAPEVRVPHVVGQDDEGIGLVRRNSASGHGK